jgi:hypothetical protein
MVEMGGFHNQLRENSFSLLMLLGWISILVNPCIFSGKDIVPRKLGVFPGRESGYMEYFIQGAVEVDPSLIM